MFHLPLLVLIDFKLRLIHLVLILASRQQHGECIKHKPYCENQEHKNGSTKAVHAGKYSKNSFGFKQRICHKFSPFLAYSLDFCLQVGSGRDIKQVIQC